MGRGRPLKSSIRQNIVEILNVKGEMYGYDIYRTYREIFPSVTLRSIYYHLKKGVSTGEFVVKEVKREKGNFSWGPETEKTYYALGPKAQAKGDSRVKEYFRK
jgi:DNA-binding PadR family transcriptional regulator